MSEYKKKIKELKRPDAFQKKLYSYIMWGRNNIHKILMVTVPILVVVLAVALWDIWQGHRLGELRAELARIEAIFNKEAESANKKRLELNKEARELSNKLAEEKDPKKKEKLTKDRDQKEKESRDLLPDHSGSLPKYQEFFSKNMDNPVGWKAGMSVAAVYLDEKKFTETAEVLEKILNKASNSEFYSLQVRTFYVSVLEEMGQFEKAAAEADKIIALNHKNYTSKALLAKARSQLLSGQQQDAFATLDVLINNHSGSNEAQKAQSIKAVWTLSPDS